MLALSPVGKTCGQCVILTTGGSCQNRRVQVAVIVSYAKTCSNRCDCCSHDEEKQKADKSLAEPSEKQTCARFFQMHCRDRGAVSCYSLSLRPAISPTVAATTSVPNNAERERRMSVATFNLCRCEQLSYHGYLA